MIKFKDTMLVLDNKNALAYVTGVALGDGNLSRVSRAIRLRISCDAKYPNIIKEIRENLEIISPYNKINTVKHSRGNSIDVYCYSNDWEKVLGWKSGDKIQQLVSVPEWIFQKKEYIGACLRGLLQTDGSIYRDRGYIMVNFSNNIRGLAIDVLSMINTLGYRANFYEIHPTNKNIRYIVRVCRDCENFINHIGLSKD